jgi:hypothetical protein
LIHLGRLQPVEHLQRRLHRWTRDAPHHLLTGENRVKLRLRKIGLTQRQFVEYTGIS